MHSNQSPPYFSINIRGQLHYLKEPQIMGILNLTPDSFYDGGEIDSISKAMNKVEQMVKEGADFIDVGAMSSRPYSMEVPIEEEMRRIKVVLPILVKEFPQKSQIPLIEVHIGGARSNPFVVFLLLKLL